MRLLVIYLFLLHLIISGKLINHTIDDTFGDELTGFKVKYSPVTRPGKASALVWNNVQQCSGCAITPNTTKAMNGTWTGATYDSSLGNVTAELAFHGSAVYIYLIVSNDPESTGLVSNVLCNFRMDGEIVGSYNHPTDGSYHFYNVAAYSNASFEDDDHTFLIETTGTQQSYVIFDYALYTANQESPASSTTSDTITASHSSVYLSSSISSSISPSSSAVISSTKSVKGLAVGIPVGIVALIIFAIVVCFRRRRRRVNLSTKHSFCFFIPLFGTIRQPDHLITDD